jgi:hypothetical protein
MAAAWFKPKPPDRPFWRGTHTRALWKRLLQIGFLVVEPARRAPGYWHVYAPNDVRPGGQIAELMDESLDDLAAAGVVIRDRDGIARTKFDWMSEIHGVSRQDLYRILRRRPSDEG